MGRSQENRAIGPDAKSWAARYGESHSLRRIRRFPEGIEPPKKVRVYARQLHFILQTWDPALKKTVSLRVDGDFLTALMKAREIEQKLAETNRSHLGRQKITCAALISAYQADLARRANAGEQHLARHGLRSDHRSIHSTNDPTLSVTAITRRTRSL